LLELLAGVVSLALGLVLVGAAVRHGGRLVSLTFWLAVALEVAVVGSLWLDWGYSWVEVVAMDMALNRNVWIAAPHALGVLALAGLAAWGARALPAVVGLVALQAASFPVALHFVALDQDMSFLAGAPLVVLYLCVVAAFLLLPAACAVIPAPGGKWHKVAFGPRAALLDAISGLRDAGLAVLPPRSVFESGAATGRVGGTDVSVTSEPSVWPLRYALRIAVTAAAYAPPPPASGPAVPPAPGFAATETVRRDGATLHYVGTSGAGFDVSPERLRAFLEAASGRAPVPSGAVAGRPPA